MSVISDFLGKCKVFLSKPIPVPFEKSLKKLQGKVRYRWMQINTARDLPDIREEVEPALERLTTQLIDESVGKQGEITKSVRLQLRGYDKNNVPLGKAAAEAILLQAVELAVSRRKLLNERLAHSVEFGSLYQAYYGRVHAVSAVAVEAYEYLEQMQMADEELRYYADMKRRVRDSTYTKESKKALDQLDEPKKRERDIMKAVIDEGL